MAAFLFTEDDVFKQIKSLSGGERGRVSLAKLMLSDANLLILDEPTNHLDMDSKEILENAIRHFEGTVLYVSHDRYFINTTATRILNLTGGHVLNYVGNYDYYLDKKEDVERAYYAAQPNHNASAIASTDAAVPSPSTEMSTADGTAPQAENNTPNAATSSNALSWQEQKEEQARLRKIQKELNRVESEIERLEAENTALDEAIADPANATNSAKLQELSIQRGENDAKLEELLEHWEELSE